MALSMAAACEKGPVGYEVDGNAVVLEAYGPNPVLRGADLTFIGQNMDKITSVILPTDKEIISSEFKEVSSESFKVTVPMDCDPGSVTLIFDGGTITAKTELSYTEPFEITSISPVGEILEMGDSVTVEGEYLNNIVAVGFINNAMNEYTNNHNTGNPIPLSVCVAMSQAYIGYDLQNAIMEEFSNRNITVPPIATLITQVVVDENDPAFKKPTKPIGQFMTKEEGEAKAKELGLKGYSKLKKAELEELINKVKAEKKELSKEDLKEIVPPIVKIFEYENQEKQNRFYGKRRKV